MLRSDDLEITGMEWCLILLAKEYRKLGHERTAEQLIEQAAQSAHDRRYGYKRHEHQ